MTGRDALASYGASSISEISDASGGEPSLLRLLGRLRARRGPLQDQQEVPAKPGVYVLWLDDGAWHGLGITVVMVVALGTVPFWFADVSTALIWMATATR